MEDRKRRSTYRSYLKGELEAAATYRALARVEGDTDKGKAFRQLAQSEMRHAARWAEKLGMDPASISPAREGLRLKGVTWLAGRFGVARVVPMLLRGEAKDIDTYSQDPEARDLVNEERDHGRVLREMKGTQDSAGAIRAEGSQYGGGSGNLRAAVLGVNDGLVSNLSLVMGVAGGTGNTDFVLLAGVAGLLAGAFSMAAGEYVSMRSQKDVYEFQISRERLEIEMWPEEEEEELVLLYQAKGLSKEEAQLVAKRVMADPEVALDTMAREELGLDPTQLGSPWGASVSSFGAFVAGALVPILPYIFGAGERALLISAILSAVALLSVGGALGMMTGKGSTWAALRMLFAGGAAAAVTYGVGSLLGISLST